MFLFKGFTMVTPLLLDSLTVVQPDFAGGHFFAILGVKVTP
jgi:hypothetical protein